jgi:hypothetical protein
VKTIRNPEGRAEAKFAKAQEAAQKDIERAFGVLQARFAIVRGPSRFWDNGTLIMTTCVILHNMIIEDDKYLNLEFFFDNVGTCVKPSKNPDKIQETVRNIKNRATHRRLKEDLIRYHWRRHGGLTTLIFISYSFMCVINIYLYCKPLVICLICWIRTILVNYIYLYVM